MKHFQSFSNIFMVFNSNSEHYTCYTSTLHSRLGLSHIRLFLYFSSKRCPCRIKILIVFIFTLDEFQGLSNILGFPLTLLPMHFFHWRAGNVNYFCVNENWVKCPFFKNKNFNSAGPMLSCSILAVLPNLQVLGCFVIGTSLWSPVRKHVWHRLWGARENAGCQLWLERT